MMKLLLRHCSSSLSMIAVRFHPPELFGHVDLMNLGILHPLFIANRGYATTTKVNTKRTKKLEEEEESSSTMGTIQVPSKVLESQPELGATFYKNLVGSHRLKWVKILEEHPELKGLRPENVKATIRMLKTLKFTSKDILKYPQLLQTSDHVLHNRYRILEECGFEDIDIHLLTKYIVAVNKSVRTLKSLGQLPAKLNVFDRLRSQLETNSVPLKISNEQRLELYNEDVPLKVLRQRLLSEYFRQILKTNEKDLDKIWNTYARIKHRNFGCLQRLLDIYTKEIGFTVDRIIRNAYLLHANPDEVLRILREVPFIDNRNIKEIVLKRPKILMSTSKTLKTSLKHIKDFGIGQDAITRCLEVLTLSPATIRKRLEALKTVAEFKVLSSNPRLLRLVHHQTKAIRRLEYLNSMKIRCTSLHILSCASHSFDKYARDGADRTRGRETIMYLCGVLDLDDQQQQQIRNILSRHPYWCQIAPLCVQQCLEYLLGKGFSKEDIYKNLHILIYPISSIDEQLQQFNEKLELLSDENLLHQLSKSKILTLVLYFIESDHHFTGNGVWMDEHCQSVDNHITNRCLPHSTQARLYNYGIRTSNNVHGEEEQEQQRQQSDSNGEETHNTIPLSRNSLDG